MNVDTTLVNVTLPTLVRELDASTRELQWIVDAYTLAFAALVLAAGSLGDRIGRREMLIVAAARGGVGQRADASGYALTPRGEEVRPALDALSRWGWELLPDQPEPECARASWAAMLMRAELEASGGAGVAGIVDFDVGGERFWPRARR